MSVYVVDASVAAKWFLDEDHAGAARKVLHADNDAHAPDFFLLEMDNLFCKRIRRGEMNAADGNDARLMLRQLPIHYYAFASLQEFAYEIANRTGRSLYDCLYVALAVVLDARMVTADRRLYNALAEGAFAQNVTWVEDVG